MPLVAWILAGVVALLWMNHKTTGRLASVFPVFGSSIDGTYVCGEHGQPMTVRIQGSKGSIDLGFIRGDLMAVERHGDTLSFSGGAVSDESGRLLSREERNVISGGNDVELFTIVDDGQSLRLDLGGGRTAKFAKQR